VGVVDGCLEKLFAGEDRVRASPDQNFRSLELTTPNRKHPVHAASAPTQVPPAI